MPTVMTPFIGGARASAGPAAAQAAERAAWNNVKAKIEAGETLSEGDFENWFAGARKFAPGGAAGATAQTLTEMAKAKQASLAAKAKAKADSMEYEDSWKQEK